MGVLVERCITNDPRLCGGETAIVATFTNAAGHETVRNTARRPGVTFGKT